MSTKIKYSSARLEKLNSPYFCIHVGLSKSKNAMCFLSSNILVSARKTASAISRADINLARPNWAENRPFSFDSHVAFIERRNGAKTTNFLHNFSLSKKAQLQQNWINPNISLWTKAECSPTLGSSVGEKNGHFDHVPYLGIPKYFRVWLCKDRSFNTCKVWSGQMIKHSSKKLFKSYKKFKITLVIECVTKHYHGIYN